MRRGIRSRMRRYLLQLKERSVIMGSDLLDKVRA